MAEDSDQLEAVDQLAVVDGSVGLVASECPECHSVVFPSRRYCPACMAEMAETVIRPRAVLETYSTIYVSPPAFESPYTAGFVFFPGHEIRAFAPLVGAAEDYDVGIRIEPTAATLGGGSPTWAFRPVSGGS